jgi:hypothetical protein
MNHKFEQSGIWLNTLGTHEADELSKERERLRNAFYSFRDNAEVLVGQIALLYQV